MRWPKSKKVAAPKQGAEKFFADVEWNRELVLYSHQMLHLKGNGIGTPGLPLSPEERHILRSLLAESLTHTLNSMPEIPLTGYKGFDLVEPFGDDRLESLEEVINFAPHRKPTKVYRVYAGVMQDAEEVSFFEAGKLEAYLKEIWIKSKRSLIPEL